MESYIEDSNNIKKFEKKDKKINTKSYRESTQIFIGCHYGYLFEHTTWQKMDIKQLNGRILVIVISIDKKSFFVSTDKNFLFQFDVNSHKCIKRVEVIPIDKMVGTHDGK